MQALSHRFLLLPPLVLAGTSSKATGPHRISIAVRNYMRTEDALYCIPFYPLYPIIHGVSVYGDS